MSDIDDPVAGGSGCRSRTPPKKKTKIWYQQAFNTEWLKDPGLKDWVKPDPTNKYTALCSVCDISLKNCNKSSLMQHQVSSKHVKNYKTKKSVVRIQSFFKKASDSEDIKDKVAKAELVLTGYVAEHSVPFRQVDHLVEAIKKMFPDCETALKMKRTKASYLLQDGIAWEEKDSIANICKKTYFSLIIDECTDVSISQVLAVMVRFYDEKKGKVTDALLDVVEVEDARAEGLYKSVKELLRSNEIPMNNIVGFASDNCSTMLGANKGFQALLKKDVPSVFILGCVCHSFALCSSHASKQLPSWLESFVKDVCCYFARSSKRQHDFQMIQDIVNAPKHKILKLSQTRWLSRGSVISRVLEQWEALQLFFQSEAKTDKVDGAAQIYKTMTNVGTKHMLLFLNYILPKVDKMNLEFQSEYFRLSTLFTTISDEYRSILGMFVSDETIHSHELAVIDPYNASLYKRVSDINLGGRCKAMLIKEPLGENEMRFRLDCQAFLVELCAQMKKRFTFDQESVLSFLKIIDPKESLSPKRNTDCIVKLALHFPTLVKEDELDILEDQWKELLFAKESLRNLGEVSTTFWLELRTVKDGHNEPKFNLLSRFMCNLLALPHSSACVEWIFSQLNMIKTKQTNRLSVCTTSNRLLAKQAIARQDVPCYQWQPSTSLIRDVQNGQCHQRYIKREDERKKGGETTLYPTVEVASDGEEDDTLTQVFVQ